MNEKIQENAVVSEELMGKRLDQAVASLFPQYSRSVLKKWILEETLTLDGKPAKPREKVKGGEVVTIDTIMTEAVSFKPQSIALEIIFEDESLLVINKPVGMVVHPAAGTPDNTLLNALLHHAPGLSNLPRAGIIHRLDKKTSGLLVVAKTLTAHHSLTKQLKERTVKRQYQTIVSGNIISGSTIDEPIGRHPVLRKKMTVIESGKEAITHYRVTERFRNHTLLNVQLETGRTHQIRVHMQFIRHPIFGDETYGERLKIPKNASEIFTKALRSFKRQALHAWKLGLTHPETNELMEFEATLPDDFNQLLVVLRQDMFENKNED